MKSVLHLSCFKKDHGNITADCPTATDANSGLVARSRYFEGGKRVTLITRPRIVSTATLHSRPVQDATETYTTSRVLYSRLTRMMPSIV